jgi:hypothetical protein
MVGAHQLQNHKTHRPTVKKIKGVLNILNGLQQLTISAINLSVLCPPSFIASAAVTFALSLDDSVYAARRLSPLFWVEDTLAQLQIDKPQVDNLEQNLRIQIQTLLIQDQEKKTKTNELALHALMEHSPYYNVNLWELKQQMKAMSPDELNAIKAKQVAIQQQIQAEFKYAIENSLIAGLALIGAILLFIPGLQIPALALLAASTAMFIGKFVAVNLNSQTLVKKQISHLLDPNNHYLANKKQPNKG